MSEKSTFAVLSAVDITDKLKKKSNLSYLPWSSAWEIIKNHFPDAYFDVVKSAEGNIYHTDGKTCWVETSMTIAGETQNEILAVMDHRNQSIPADTVASTAYAKSIKRCLVKNAALFGLGLSLWNGEELSDAAKETKKKKEKAEAVEAAALAAENAKIVALCKDKIAKGVDQASLYAVIERYTGGKKNPNAIETIEESQACYEEISKMTKGGK